MSEETSGKSARPPRFTLAALFVVMALIAAFLAITVPGVRSARENALRTSCSNNLRQIAYALQAYHGTYRCLPPAFLADAEGKPMHSWRVLLVPYMESTPLYAKYNFGEPWDGPSNGSLFASVPTFYSCPLDYEGREKRCTSYVAVVGPETYWPGATSVRAHFKQAEQEDTLLIVEVINSGIAWNEPRDLDLAQIAGVNDPHGHGPSSAHIGGALAARPDGQIEFLPNSLTVEELRALLRRK